MRLVCRKIYRKCMLLVIVTVLVLSLAMWMLDPLVHNQNAARRRVIAPVKVKSAQEKEYHSKNLLQLSSLPSLYGLQPPSSLPLTGEGPSQARLQHLSTSLLPIRVPSQILPVLPSFIRPSQLPLQLPSDPKHSNCKQPHCEELLSRTDRIRKNVCLSEILKRNTNKISPKELASKISDNNCNFMEGGKRTPVALVSAEGSGNTWVRGLLEKSSGFCTGFNFCDYVMRIKGFVGENVNSGSVLVVKTHMKLPQWIGSESKRFNKYEAKYGSAIFLQRNPYYSLIAEWNRRLTNDILIKQNKPHNESHVNVAPKEIWFSNSWDEFLQSYMTSWVQRIQNWILVQSPDHPVIVVRYEDLKQDTIKEVGRMLGFLRIHISLEDLSQRLQEDFTTFKRPHCKICDFKRYTPDQKLHIKSSLQQAIHQAEEKNMTGVLKLEEYLNVFSTD